MGGANATEVEHFITKGQLDVVYTEATFKANVNYNDSSPILLGNITAGTKTIITTLTIGTAFDDANAAVTVGTSANNSLLMSDDYCEIENTGVYQTINVLEINSNTSLNIYVTQAAATAGAGNVLVSVVDGPVVDGGTINYGTGGNSPTNTITNTDGYNNFHVTVEANGLISMNTARGGLEIGAMPEIGAPQHLHIMRPAGQGSTTDLYFGDDYNYIRMPGLYGSGTQGVDIGSSYNNGTVHVWRFDTDGNLKLPAGGGIVDSTGNSVLGVGGITLANISVTSNSPSGNGSLTYNNSTGVFTFTPADLSSVAGNYGNSNVVTLLSSFGSNTITTTGNVSVGNLAVTGNVSGNIKFTGANVILNNGTGAAGPDEGGELHFATPSANTTLNGPIAIDIFQNKIRFFETSGNNRGAFIDLANCANLAATNLITSSGSYSDSNVVTLLSSYGSNTVITTGNIDGGNINTTGNVRFTSAEASDTARIFADVSGSNTSLVLEIGDDNADSIVLRHYSYGAGNTIDMLKATRLSNTAANVTITGDISATGNISAGNINSAAGRSIFLGNTSSSLRQLGSNASVNLGGSVTLIPDTSASALNGVQIGGNGYLLGPNGSRNITLNYSANGGVGFQSNITVGTAGIGGTANIAGATTTGINSLFAGVTNTILSNTIAAFSASVNSYTQVTLQNKSTGADATADFVITADNGSDTVNFADFGIINSGYDNTTPTNSLGNIVFAADTYLYAQGNTSNAAQPGGNIAIGTTVSGKTVKIFAGGANSNAIIGTFSNTGLAVSGNVTAQNFSGNISITGNVTGTSQNVSLVAGAFTTTFDNTGNLVLPGNTFAVKYANGTPVDAVTRFEGTWTVPTGNSTQSFTVDAGNTYHMWVEGNIPNGIITWNATASITNTNVPVVGAQYAWVYNGGGTPIDFTSIPNQFVGTANTIVRSSGTGVANTNVFAFGINNTSGSTQVVRYGWVQIS